jgi:dephospho-CoA kinase
MPSIEIVPANPSWPNEFELISQTILNSAGHLLVKIDHIGSTAVPSLPAKDVIDIQITVPTLPAEDLKQALVKLGYEHSEQISSDNLVGYNEGDPELAKIYFHEQRGARKAHIHVREQGRLNQNYPLVFRDFLRQDAQSRQAYAAVKIELAKQFPNDANRYYAIKDPYMDTLYKAATLWAQLTGWKQENNSNA